MKHSIKFGLMGGMILFCLSMSLTSCEDILGEWSRPTPNPVTPGGGSEGGGSTTIAVTGVKLNEAYLRFDKSVLTAQTLTATVEPADASDKTVTWKSSDESVATVDENGQVTPKTKGKVTITATAHDGSGIKATSTVIVYDKIHNINTDGNASVSAGEWLIEGNGTAVAKSITIGDGAKVTLNGINIIQQIICSNTGNSTIILADGSENEVTVSTDEKAGIKIGGTGTLTIDAETAGDGKLTAKGGSKAAGIGTNKNENGGNIIIEGGVIEATGGEYAAGIGTGYVNSGTKTFGTITINGGTVTATGGDYGAGIGTGFAAYSSSTNTCSAITINGGTVTATGGVYAAGIGTGLADHATNECGAITIGTGVISVTATKGTSSPNSIGIGDKDSATQTCGTITIGGVEYWDGAAYQNGGDNATTGLPHSPYTYTPAP